MIQFYALPEELIPLIEEWKGEFAFRMVVVQLFPEMKAFEIDSFEDVANLPIEINNIYSVLLGFAEPVLDEKNRYAFLVKNKEFLTIDLGKLTEKGLEESALLGETDDVGLLSVWKKLARQLKKITKAGLWAVNTERGGKGFYKSYRYTEGACKLSQNGVKLLSHGPFVYLSVEEPRT